MSLWSQSFGVKDSAVEDRKVQVVNDSDDMIADDSFWDDNAYDDDEDFVAPKEDNTSFPNPLPPVAQPGGFLPHFDAQVALNDTSDNPSSNVEKDDKSIVETSDGWSNEDYEVESSPAFDDGTNHGAHMAYTEKFHREGGATAHTSLPKEGDESAPSENFSSDHEIRKQNVQSDIILHDAQEVNVENENRNEFNIEKNRVHFGGSSMKASKENVADNAGYRLRHRMLNNDTISNNVSPAREGNNANFVFLSDQKAVPSELKRLQEKTRRRRREMKNQFHNLECQVALAASSLAEEKMDLGLAISDTFERSCCQPLEEAAERVVIERETVMDQRPAVSSIEKRISKLSVDMMHHVHIEMNDAKKNEIDNLRRDLLQEVIPSIRIEKSKRNFFGNKAYDYLCRPESLETTSLFELFETYKVVKNWNYVILSRVETKNGFFARCKLPPKTEIYEVPKSLADIIEILEQLKKPSGGEIRHEYQV